ncbi:hypothetical protein ABIC21_003638 [Pseudarthrobacter sp. PvP090]
MPERSAGLIEMWRRLEELSSAMAVARTRLEVALILCRAPTYASGMGTSPMATEAADRLLLAVNNVLALRDT